MLNIDWPNVGLGTKPDAELAAELGCSQTSVCKARRALGIEASRKYPPKRQPYTTTPADIDWLNVGLGTQYDNAIANELGVSAQVVRRHRLRLGIDRYKRVQSETPE